MRAAVVGVGNMGVNHVRVLAEIKGCVVAGVYDPDLKRAQMVAGMYGCPVLGSIDEVVKVADAAIVATPSCTHAEVAGRLLEGGLHCLIEKPLALDEAQCLKLIEIAERRGLQLMVGHIERFNPAVMQLRAVLAERQVYTICARRMSAASARIVDVDVVMDLMIHDLDIALTLLGPSVSVVDVNAMGFRQPDSPSWDHVNALVSFSNGATGNFTASRMTENKIRELEVNCDSGYLHIDYIRQELHAFRQSRVVPLSPSSGNYTLDIAMDRVFVRNSEPLTLELRNFCDSVRLGRPIGCTGQEALRALRLGWHICQELGR